MSTALLKPRPLRPLDLDGRMQGCELVGGFWAASASHCLQGRQSPAQGKMHCTSNAKGMFACSRNSGRREWHLQLACNSGHLSVALPSFQSLAPVRHGDKCVCVCHAASKCSELVVL